MARLFVVKKSSSLFILLCVWLVFSSVPYPVHAQAEIEPGESGPQGPTVNPPATTIPSTAVAPATPSSGGFVPLTNLPGLPDDTGKRTLADYINVLFRLSIGIGALIAVIKITFAGIKYMGTDSFSSKEEAKKDITGALFGLLIMLSTVVILQLIYPNILNINVLQKLEPVEVQTSSGTGGPVQTGAGTTLNLPNGQNCVDPRNCSSGYCKPPATGQMSEQNAGTCQAAPTQSGLPKDAECNAGQQPNPCVAPLKCTTTLTPCTTNVTGFCGKSTCQP